MRQVRASQDLITRHPVELKAPSLPSHIRYFDDYLNKSHTLSFPAKEDIWHLHHDGIKTRLDFSIVDPKCRQIFKAVASEQLHRLDVTGVASGISICLRNHEYVETAIPQDLHEFQAYWLSKLRQTLSRNEIQPIRTFMHSLCILGVGNWNESLRPQISALSSPNYDLYKGVRTQSSIIDIGHESEIVEYLDDLSKTIQKEGADYVSYEDLQGASILILCHQFGFRTGQLARIQLSNVRAYANDSLHIAVPLLKQRGNNRMRLITRRLNRAWIPVFSEFLSARNNKAAPSGIPHDSLFLLKPPAITKEIKNITNMISGVGYTANDFRHTAAQRLADSGASPESITEFLGHANALSATYYFDASSTQAERINDAMAISPIYATVARVHARRTIDPSDLAISPPDMQIAGAPHGIPVSGIGLCNAGQPLCEKNPILSCYTCRKFLPVSDRETHQNVLDSLRPIVREFSEASVISEESPAYTQLKRMFSAVNEVMRLIDEGIETSNE